MTPTGRTRSAPSDRRPGSGPALRVFVVPLIVLLAWAAFAAGDGGPAPPWALPAAGAGGLAFLAGGAASAAWRRRPPLDARAERARLVYALAAVLDDVDPYTRRHSLRVAGYARSVARALRLPESEVEEIEYGALLHDLGKLHREHHEVLVKRAPLSTEEARRIRRHPDQGADLVARFPGLERVAEYVRTHHERLDGAGYPRGLGAGALPIGARVIVVCDAFDAMTSDRPYRAAVAAADAFDELWRCAGTQFDARVVDALALCVERGWIEIEAEAVAVPA